MFHKTVPEFRVEVRTTIPLRRPKKIFGAFGANTFRQNLNLEKDGFENFGGSGGGGGLEFEQAAPLASMPELSVATRKALKSCGLLEAHALRCECYLWRSSTEPANHQGMPSGHVSSGDARKGMFVLRQNLTKKKKRKPTHTFPPLQLNNQHLSAPSTSTQSSSRCQVPVRI